MFPATFFTLVVLGVVVCALLIRYVTEYSPESPVRRWATRGAVAAISLWFASVLTQEAKVQHSLFDLVLSRRFIRGIVAVVLVWSVYGDEL